jgi:hypothetical protein
MGRRGNRWTDSRRFVIVEPGLEAGKQAFHRGEPDAAVVRLSSRTFSPFSRLKAIDWLRVAVEMPSCLAARVKLFCSATATGKARQIACPALFDPIE